MGRTIRITQEQLERIFESEFACGGAADLLYESVGSNYQAFKEKVLSMVKKGVLTAAIAISAINNMVEISNFEKENIKTEIAAVAPAEQWKEVANDVIVTVYNARPEQCNSDFGVTASGFRLNLNDVSSHKIVAMERTFMAELGLKYGDVIKLEGTYLGKQDGIFVVHDTMNRKYANMHKVDVLVPDNIRYGGTLKDSPAKIYILNNKNDTEQFTSKMAPAISKKESLAQMQNKREQMNNKI